MFTSPPTKGQGGTDKISFRFWKIWIKPEQIKNSYSRHHSFNVFFSITNCNFLITDSRHDPSIFACLHFTLTHYLHLKSYRNHVREISRNFKDPARVGLAVLKKIVIFWRFQNDSIDLFGITSEENWFLIEAAKTCLYGLSISENIETEHVF